MHVVIEIDSRTYDRMKSIIESDNHCYHDIGGFAMKTILNGTPLPKGHGDLIDISKLPVTTTYFGISDKPTTVVNYNCILNAKKIIKADRNERR